MQKGQSLKSGSSRDRFKFKTKTCESFCDGVDVYLTEEDMTEKEKELCKTIVPVSLYEDFSIPLDEIFYNLL